MAKRREDGPALAVTARQILQGYPVQLRGAGWGKTPLSVQLDGKAVAAFRVLQGARAGAQVTPDQAGAFELALELPLLAPGRHAVAVVSADRTITRKATFEVAERFVMRNGARDADRPFLRLRDFFLRRFGRLGFVPPGIKAVQLAEIEKLRRHRDALKDRLLKTPVSELAHYHGHDDFAILEGLCLHLFSLTRWTPVGPGPVATGQTEGGRQPVSGRVISIAVAPVDDPTDKRTLLIGTAAGGIWKSVDDGQTWAPKSDRQPSLAVNAIAIDPHDAKHVIAGTGDRAGGWLSYYGLGLLVSTDGGETWVPKATEQFGHDHVIRIVFDPTDGSSQRIFLLATSGLWQSEDGGDHWKLLAAGIGCDLVVIAEPGRPTLTLIVAFMYTGLRTATRTGDAWSDWSAIEDPAFPPTPSIAKLGQCRDQPLVVYAAFSEGASITGMARSTNGGGSWTRISRPGFTIRSLAFGIEQQDHEHDVFFPGHEIAFDEPPRTYRTEEAGNPSHGHRYILTWQQFGEIAGGGHVTVRTEDDDTGHHHIFDLRRDFGMFTSRTAWNFHLAVSPTDPATVYCGETQLWKTETGDAPWLKVTDGETDAAPGVPIGIHVDQHVVAFDPVDPQRAWAGNDGGIYHTANGGRRWQHGNRDLATLQYMHLASHPVWDAVLLGGTQDNGTHRYAGHPAWAWVEGGDGGVAVIDPEHPTRMYHGFNSGAISRSSDAGASWEPLPMPGGVVAFYPPFCLDPADPSICYFGNTRLWRSTHYGGENSWEAVSDALPILENVGHIIQTIAVDPSNSDVVYFGTSGGRVYRVVNTGAAFDVTWLRGDDVFDGRWISAVAVDLHGNVWAAIASVEYTQATGEFEGDHVYYRAVDGTRWESRSSGLPKATPINTIVVDPADPDGKTLFCGGDVGVFRTDDAGTCWLPWDEGLPNAPVFHLDIHQPTRLLRAATHGRSVWERRIDRWVARTVDLYVRDNLVDTGRATPSPSAVPHPFQPATNIYWWDTPDIKVDASQPEYQTTAAVTDFLAFEALEDEAATLSVPHRVYVQLHNRGPRTATDVRVRVFATTVPDALLPANFWSDGRPFTGDAGNQHWRPVGLARTIPAIAPAEPAVVSWEWTPDAGQPDSSLYSFLALVTCADDRLEADGILDARTLVRERKHAAMKTVGVIPSLEPPDFVQQVYIPERLVHIIPRDLRIDWGTLPGGTRIRVGLAPKAVTPAARQTLKDAGVTISTRPMADFAPSLGSRRVGKRLMTGGPTYELRRPKSGTTMLPGVLTATDRPQHVAFRIVLPDPSRRPAARFQVSQQVGKDVLSGVTYLLRASKAAAAVKRRSRRTG